MFPGYRSGKSLSAYFWRFRTPGASTLGRKVLQFATSAKFCGSRQARRPLFSANPLALAGPGPQPGWGRDRWRHLHTPQAPPSALAGRRPLLAICSEAPMPASPSALVAPASTPLQGLPARVPPQTAPRDGWGCRRRRWRSGDTRGRSRRARESRSLPGS